jgi:hypothetical protein
VNELSNHQQPLLAIKDFLALSVTVCQAEEFELQINIDMLHQPRMAFSDLCELIAGLIEDAKWLATEICNTMTRMQEPN